MKSIIQPRMLKMDSRTSGINTKDYFTVRQVSIISGRSEGAIRRRIQEGKLTYIKVGYSILIPKEAVEKLKKKQAGSNNK